MDFKLENFFEYQSPEPVIVNLLHDYLKNGIQIYFEPLIH